MRRFENRREAFESLICRIRRVSRDAIWYALAPLVGGLLSPLLTYPVVTYSLGIQSFASLALGSSVGTACGVIGELSWSVVGPQAIAAAANRRRYALYSWAQSTRICSVGVLSVLVAGILLLFPTSDYWGALFACYGSMSSALSSAWLYVGLNNPLRIVLFEAIPRATLSLVAADIVYFGGPLWSVGACWFLSVVVTIALTWFIDGWKFSLRTRSVARGFQEVGRNSGAVVGRIIGTVQGNLPIPMVSALNIASYPGFSGIERLWRMVQTVMGSLLMRLQSWVVLPPNDRDPFRRVRPALLISVLIGLLSGVLGGVAFPSALRIVYVGSIEITGSERCLVGLLIVFACGNIGANIALVAVKYSNWLAVFNAFGLVIYGVLAVLMVPSSGVLGALGAELWSLASTFTLQVLAIEVALRRRVSRSG